MNIKLVIKVLSFLLIFIGIALLLPIPFSVYYGTDIWNFLIPSLVCLSFGIMSFLNSDKKDDFKVKDGFLIVVLGWTLMAFVGTMPYVMSGAIPSFSNAFFESMSGFTTTGATILIDIESLPKDILLWRSLTHWIGGMGIVVLSIAILPFLGIGGMQLFRAEASTPLTDRLKPRIAETAKILWGVYLLYTVLHLILLLFAGLDFYDSLNHSFSSMATGGFSTKNDSIAGFSNPVVHYIIIVFMFLAGTNFTLHYQLLKGNFRAMFGNPEFKFYIFMIGLGTIIIFSDLYFNAYAGIEKSFRDGLFQVISLGTSTGYASVDYEQWSFGSQMMIFVLMLGGGMAGSTAGGLKLIRILLLIKYLKSQFTRILHPKAIVPIKLGGKKIDPQIMSDIMSHFILFAFISILGLLFLSLIGLDFITAVTATIATLNSMGPGLADVGPTNNYDFVPDVGKWVLSLFMIIGRLELFTFLVILTPAFWKK